MTKYEIVITVETELDEDDSVYTLHDSIINALSNIMDINNFGLTINNL